MMPRAKMVRRRSWPPVNMSARPRKLPRLASKYCCNLSAFTPGGGMWPPRRYTANSPSVNKIRLRRSGMRKMLASLSNIYLQDLKFAARLGDLFLGGFRKLMRVHGERGRELARAQNLHRMLGADHAGLAQDVGTDRRLAQERELVQIHDVKFLAENIGEPALRHAPVQGHLAALKTAHHARTAARPLALVSAGGGLAHAGTHTAADALLVFGCLLRCSNI